MPPRRTTLMHKRAVLAVLAAPLVLAPGASSVNAHASQRAVCPAGSVGAARCHAHVVTDERGNPLASTSPSGYGPV